MRSAEWALSIVSAMTLMFSLWVSVILPRQVVKPLISLREAVDHAAQGSGAVDLEIKGRGEVAELAKSVHNLIVHLRHTPRDLVLRESLGFICRRSTSA